MSPPVHHHHVCHLHQPLTATLHHPSRLTEQNALTQSLKDLSNTSLGPSRPLDFSYPSLLHSSAFSPTSLPPPRPSSSSSYSSSFKHNNSFTLTNYTNNLSDNFNSAALTTNHHITIWHSTVQFAQFRDQQYSSWNTKFPPSRLQVSSLELCSSPYFGTSNKAFSPW